MKIFDLENRCFEFGKACRDFCKMAPKTQANFEYSKQLIRSSGSVGANYIEANEALGLKDFQMRIRISRKETKESRHWLKLLEGDNQLELRDKLLDEASQLIRIFSAILKKT